MANRSYLTCAKSKQLFPSNREERFSPRKQTVACGQYCVPLLWLGCFRNEDLVITQVEHHDEFVEVRAPIVHRRRIRKRLEEAAQRLQGVVSQDSTWPVHANLLREAIESIDSDYPYLTIEWEEIGCLQDEKQFFRDAIWVMDYFGGARKQSVADRMESLTFCPIDLGSEFLDPRTTLEDDFTDKDCESIGHLLGAKWERKIPWEPKPIRRSAAKKTEEKKKKREGIYYGDTPGASQRVANHNACADFAAGKIAKAQRCFSKVVRKAGAYAEAWFNRGNCYWEQGNFEMAVANYDTAALRKKRFTEAYVCAAMLRLHLHRFEESLSNIEKALKLKSNEATYLALRAGCWMGLGQIQKGEKEFQRLAKKYPRASDVPELWAAAITRNPTATKKDQVRSVKLAIQACEMDTDGDHEKWIVLAESQAAVGEIDKAIEAMNAAIKMTPGEIKDRLRKLKRKYETQRRR